MLNQYPQTPWQPSADIVTLKKRAQLIRAIREFFYHKNVLEVDTPALSHAAVTDQHLHSFSTCFNDPMSPQEKTLFLQTSPEFAMKRLLCAGSGSIYQICKSFRNEEAGRFHNPEFTMLEWYRVGYDHHQLMAEVDELVQLILGTKPAERMTYQQAFQQHLKCDPLTASLDELRLLAGRYGYQDIAANESSRDTLMMLLFSQHIEPHIGQERPCLVYEFPASQAALAKISKDNPLVAERFELYFKGVELANGFHELSDADEQRQRFEQDNQTRLSLGLQNMPLDKNLIAALKHGLPDCAGVALGIDRLLMLALNCVSIDQVTAFEHNRA
ncbi:MAG: elongation factor P--(R)-beta-lysine ligase [Paraglaciecola sp.]|uniref:elongation factor P--(R)-beta-lysine ligase n=1 Tax=Paraglaciecola sp. TaxID=1920173 RepID=UPI003299B0E5